MKSHLVNQPVALWPGHAAQLLREIRLEYLSPPAQQSLTDEWKPYEIVQGMAIVPVRGILVHETAWWGWGETSYSSIARSIMTALQDNDVKTVALHINSPGGEVSGCFDLADVLYDLRGEKPIVAVVDEMAFSAAYALACCADEIYLPRTGGVGSVGVITMHLDITKMLEKSGILVTTVQYGDQKSDTYPTTPLSDDARARLQADVDLMGEMFVNLVARGRGIRASEVRDTQAGCFLGDEAVNVGFADAVMSVEQAFLDIIKKGN